MRQRYQLQDKIILWACVATVALIVLAALLVPGFLKLFLQSLGDMMVMR
jgi:hypothetical protein